MTSDDPGAARITAITFGCSDPSSLAAFYRAAAGLHVLYESEQSTYLSDGSDLRVGFDSTTGAAAAPWDPNRLPFLRIDLATDDLPTSEERLLALGATRPGHSADTDDWHFLADPAGNALCLTRIY